MELVLYALDRLGLTQRALAKMIGVEKSTIYRWTKGHQKVHPCAVRIMGMALEVPGAITWLLNTTEVVTGKRPVQKKAARPDDSNDSDRTAPWN